MFAVERVSNTIMLKMCHVSCSKDGKEEKQEEGTNRENSLAIVGKFFKTSDERIM